MRYRFRSLIHVAWVAAALAPFAVVWAAQPTNSKSSMSALVQAAAEQMDKLNYQLEEIEAQATLIPGGATRSQTRQDSMLGTNDVYGFADLRRSATRLAQVADDIRGRTAACEEDTSRLGQNFKKQTQQLLTAVNRLGFQRDASVGPMTLSQIRFALGATEDALREVSGMEACAAPD